MLSCDGPLDTPESILSAIEKIIHLRYVSKDVEKIRSLARNWRRLEVSRKKVINTGPEIIKWSDR